MRVKSWWTSGWIAARASRSLIIAGLVGALHGRGAPAEVRAEPLALVHDFLE
jgi:hypothetical protein